MTRALVVCPATEEIEQVEFVATPIGALIHACSRFSPATALDCGRACAWSKRCTLARQVPRVDEAETSEAAGGKIVRHLLVQQG